MNNKNLIMLLLAILVGVIYYMNYYKAPTQKTGKSETSDVPPSDVPPNGETPENFTEYQWRNYAINKELGREKFENNGMMAWDKLAYDKVSRSTKEKFSPEYLQRPAWEAQKRKLDKRNILRYGVKDANETFVDGLL